MIIDKLTLIMGVPISIPSLGLTINQPTLKDIAAIGEDRFYTSLAYFLITKKALPEEFHESEISDLEVFLFFLSVAESMRLDVVALFQLCIDDLDSILFFQDEIKITLSSGQECIINQEGFSLLKEIFKQIFKLGADLDKYNPANSAAEKIAEKLKKRQEKISKLKSDKENEDSKISNLISVLAIGSNSNSLKDLENFTLYQFLVQIQRFGMYESYNNQISAMMQGAEDIELVDWYKKI